jgi:hypothetical protein
MLSMNHSDSDHILAQLRAAAGVVDQLDLPGHLEAAAFSAAATCLLRAPVADATQAAELAPGPDPVVDRVAARLGVSAESIDETLVIEGEDVRVVVSPRNLPDRKARATRWVALVTAAARQAAGVDAGWTDVAVVREQCREIGVLDPANFSTEVAAMGDVFAMKGAGRNRQLKVTSRGFEEAGRLLMSAARGESR